MTYPTRAPDFEALRLGLSRRRADLGWSYDLLADRSGVTRRTLIAIETGTTNGSLESWFRISQALGVEFGELLAEI